jgi:hypothetical protein
MHSHITIRRMRRFHIGAEIVLNDPRTDARKRRRRRFNVSGVLVLNTPCLICLQRCLVRIQPALLLLEGDVGLLQRRQCGAQRR